MEIEVPDEAGAAAFDVVVAPVLAVSDAAPGALIGAGGGAGEEPRVPPAEARRHRPGGAAALPRPGYRDGGSPD